MNEDLFIRPADEGDADVIVGNWLRCYGSPFWGSKQVRMGAFKLGHKRVIARCLSAPWAANVAALDAAPHVVIGWACGGPGVLHYVYVKKEFRREGVARALLESLCCGEGELTVTHFSSVVERWRKVRSVHFDPYLVIG